MAKFIEEKIVRFIGFDDVDGNPAEGWQQVYLGLSGLLCIYESEHKVPGKRFIYFYPNEPDMPMQRYFHSSIGDLKVEGTKIRLTTNHIYTFEEGNFISDDDALIIKLNVHVH